MCKAQALLLLAGILQSCILAPADKTSSPAPPEQLSSGWRGFAPGSWTLVGEFRIGREDAGPMSLFRDEVIAIDPDGNSILKGTWKRRESGDFQPSGSPFFYEAKESITAGKVERAWKRETITLGGRTLDCRVVEYADAQPGPDREGVLTLWKGDGVALPPRILVGPDRPKSLPGDVVRAKLRSRSPGESIEVDWEVDGFDAPLEVSGRHLHCVTARMSSVTTNENGYRVLRSWRTWLSPDVPGGIVRRERQCTDSAAARPHEYIVRDEVTAFNAVR